MDGLTEEPTASRESQEPFIHPKGTCRDAETGPVAHYRDFNENRFRIYGPQIGSHCFFPWVAVLRVPLDGWWWGFIY